MKWLKSIINKPATAVILITALLTFIGVIINAINGYVIAGLPIRATQTAAANISLTNQISTPLLSTAENSISVGGNNSGIIVQGAGGDVTINQSPITFTPFPTTIPTTTVTPIGGGNGNILFLDEKTCSIYKIGSNGKDLTRLAGKSLIDAEMCMGNTSFSISHDGTKVVFTYFETDSALLFIMNSDGTEQKQLTYDNELSVYYSPDWSPNDKEIITSTAFGEIFLIDIESANKKFLANGYGAIWSPKGDRIAFLDYDNNIYTMSPDGSDISLIESNIIDFSGYQWHPDGTHIVFVANYNNSTDIYIKDTEEPYSLTPVTQNFGTEWNKYITFSFALSPDGKYIAFPFLDNSGQRNIHIINVDGSNFHQLVNKPSSYFPSWSPDGSQISFVHTDTTGSEILTVKSDGTQITFVTLSSEWGLPTWQP